jgi:hypothetical protein
VGETPLTGEEHLSIGCQTPENLEGLTEKVCTLGLQATKKNRGGATKKWVRRARLAEVPTGDSRGGQPQLALVDQSQNLQKPGISGAQHRKGLVPAKHTSREWWASTRPKQMVWLAGGTLEDGRAKSPKQIGQPTYARASREGHQVALVCEDYPKSQVSRENFLDVQQAISWHR